MDTYKFFTHFSPQLRAKNIDHALQQLSWKIGATTDLDMTWVYSQLTLQEKHESSAIGDGVAIAHIKSTPLNEPVVLVATLDLGIEMKADDEKLVDIICLVLSPSNDGPIHLQRLSRITRLLRDQILCENLRHAVSEDDLKAALQQEYQTILAA